jgi:hypothetical protein
LLSLRTYTVLSPDLRMRRRINRALCDRPALSQSEWFTAFYQNQGIARPVAEFTYVYLERYSGIAFSRVLPSDRLSDLEWTSVCSFDWELKLCDDFYDHFGIDLSDCLDGLQPVMIGDLVCFLNQHWLSKHSSFDDKTSAV